MHPSDNAQGHLSSPRQSQQTPEILKDSLDDSGVEYFFVEAMGRWAAEKCMDPAAAGVALEATLGETHLSQWGHVATWHSPLAGGRCHGAAGLRLHT